MLFRPFLNYKEIRLMFWLHPYFCFNLCRK
nr:MAG TPA: hypothetical protein [Caudoviricetes sp.]DAY93137.1 MAG TPA: hypothetical protein [Caudoviricetes sp.]